MGNRWVKDICFLKIFDIRIRFYIGKFGFKFKVEFFFLNRSKKGLEMEDEGEVRVFNFIYNLLKIGVK